MTLPTKLPHSQISRLFAAGNASACQESTRAHSKALTPKEKEKRNWLSRTEKHEKFRSDHQRVAGPRKGSRPCRQPAPKRSNLVHTPAPLRPMRQPSAIFAAVHYIVRTHAYTCEAPKDPQNLCAFPSPVCFQVECLKQGPGHVRTHAECRPTKGASLQGVNTPLSQPLICTSWK